MKAITQNERPIGKGTNYIYFFSEDIVKETDKAFFVSIYYYSSDVKSNRWLPKSKMLVYDHIDNRDLIDNGKDYVKNPNYGKNRSQFFISSFFAKDNGEILRTDIKDEQDDVLSENQILGVKGIDY